MKTSTMLLSTLCIAMLLCNDAIAQRGGGRGGPPGGPPGGSQGGPPPGLNQDNQAGNQNQQAFGNQFGNQNGANQNAANQNENGNQNMPSVAELSQMMIANFDADGSGTLGQAELRTALTALRQMMQNRGNGQNQAGEQDGGFANQQQNQFQGRGNFQADQAQLNQGQANRPPRGGGRGRGQ